MVQLTVLEDCCTRNGRNCIGLHWYGAIDLGEGGKSEEIPGK